MATLIFAARCIVVGAGSQRTFDLAGTVKCRVYGMPQATLLNSDGETMQYRCNSARKTLVHGWRQVTKHVPPAHQHVTIIKLPRHLKLPILN